MATKIEPSISTTNGLLVQPMLDAGLRVEVVTIDKDLATKWLRRNHVNRRLRLSHVAKLVRSLKAGTWEDLNGETIKLVMTRISLMDSTDCKLSLRRISR